MMETLPSQDAIRTCPDVLWLPSATIDLQFSYMAVLYRQESDMLIVLHWAKRKERKWTSPMPLSHLVGCFIVEGPIFYKLWTWFCRCIYSRENLRRREVWCCSACLSWCRCLRRHVYVRFLGFKFIHPSEDWDSFEYRANTMSTALEVILFF